MLTIFLLHPWPYFCWLLFHICYFSSFEVMKFCVSTWGRSAFRSWTRPRQKWNAMKRSVIWWVKMDYSKAFLWTDCNTVRARKARGTRAAAESHRQHRVRKRTFRKFGWKDLGEMITRISKEIKRTFAAGKRISSFQPHLAGLVVATKLWGDPQRCDSCRGDVH